MHAARLSTSPRLRRVLAVLASGRPRTTRQIVREARVMAVSACIAELRENGAEILCEAYTDRMGQRRYRYTLTRAPEAAPARHPDAEPALLAGPSQSPEGPATPSGGDPSPFSHE